MSHTAELKKVASDWNIAHKIYCLVTNNASNMVAAAKLTGWRHIPCFAHTLNLIVQKATDKDSELSQLHQECQNIVTFLKQSVKARDKLTEAQRQMAAWRETKLIRVVVTRWNSSFYMYQQLLKEYKAVNITLCLFDKSAMLIFCRSCHA